MLRTMWIARLCIIRSCVLTSSLAGTIAIQVPNVLKDIQSNNCSNVTIDLSKVPMLFEANERCSISSKSLANASEERPIFSKAETTVFSEIYI